jgi:hypothetical protein
MTRPMSCASPSSSRRRQCAAGSAWPNEIFTQTSSSHTSTGQEGVSSAHSSNVQPLSRSKQA